MATRGAGEIARMAEGAVAPDVDGRTALAEAVLPLADGVRPLAVRLVSFADGLLLPTEAWLPLVGGVRLPAVGAPPDVDVAALAGEGAPCPCEEPPRPVVRARPADAMKRPEDGSPPVVESVLAVDGWPRLRDPLAAARTSGAAGPPRTVDAAAGPHADGPSTARSTSKSTTLRT